MQVIVDISHIDIFGGFIMKKKVLIIGCGGGPKMNLVELLKREDLIIQIDSDSASKRLPMATSPKIDELSIISGGPIKPESFFSQYKEKRR